MPILGRPTPEDGKETQRRYQRNNEKNTAIKERLPSFAQNLGPVVGGGDRRETTGKERQDDKEEKTIHNRLNLLWLAVFSCCRLMRQFLFLHMRKKTERKRKDPVLYHVSHHHNQKVGYSLGILGCMPVIEKVNIVS